MPRYNYECGLCGVCALYTLPMNTKPEKCISCDMTGSLNRSWGTHTITVLKTNLPEGEQPTGTITKEYIEENRKILEQQKNEAVSDEYEPS